MKLAAAASLLLLAFTPILAAASDTYVDGMVIAQFKAEYMPTVAQVSLSGPTPYLGQQGVDDVLRSHRCYRIRKYLSTFGRETSSAGRLLERSFIIYYADGTDPWLVRDELATFACFEDVRLNRRLHKVYGGTNQFIPGEFLALEPPGQWNLHSPDHDHRDIDAPEAWAIERGDPNVIIGIIDSGMMIDVSDDDFQGKYRLHVDLPVYFNACEDSAPKFEAGSTDLNDTDDDFCEDFDDAFDFTDPLARIDNVVGHTFSDVPAQITDPLQQKFWKAMPHDWIRRPPPDPPWWWDPHGTMVSSVAASTANTFFVAGVANQCRAYVLRDGGAGTDAVQETDAILMAAGLADVINMSWAFVDDPSIENPEFRAAIVYATEGLDRVLVSIAGNISDGLLTVGYPGRYPEVLAVGNIDSTLSLYDSASGPDTADVSLVAPVGAGIPAAASERSGVRFPYTFTENVADFGGTSAAAPQVAGVAALIRSRFPNLNQAQVRARLLRSAQWYWGTTTEDTIKYGAGKLNAYRALTQWGSITADRTWNAADTRDRMFYISGDLTIEPGVTLTINPGVVVKVAPDNEQSPPDLSRVRILVKGSLVLNGTAENPIVFESFTDSPDTNTDWTGIWFEAGSSGTLNHVVIRNAQNPIRSFVPLTLNNCRLERGIDGLHAHQGAVVRNTTIHDFWANGILWYAGNLELRNVEVCNAAYGVSQSGSGAGTFLCRDSNFHDITFTGIGLLNPTSGVTIAHSTVEEANDGIVLAVQPWAAIDTCRVRKNDIGITLYGGSDVSIRHCTIDSSIATGVYLVGYTDYASTVMQADTLQYNPVGAYFWGGSGGRVQSSRIVYNSLGLKCDEGSIPVVRNTRIAWGGSGVMAVDGSNPDLGHATGGTCGSGSQEGHNSIHNHTAHHVANFDPAVTVCAECNWWGGTPAPHRFYGSVDYTPYQSSDPNPSAPIEPPPPGPDPSPDIPETYALYASRPNPFNPTTTMRYDVPAPGGAVSIVIYDASGARVKILVNRSHAPGVYQATWEGRDERGAPVASGVYFVQMKSGSFTQARKAVLLK